MESYHLNIWHYTAAQVAPSFRKYEYFCFAELSSRADLVEQ